MTDLPLVKIVNYFRSISKQHILVNNFMASEPYDMNFDSIVYPLIHLEYPISLAVVGQLADELSINMTLNCFTNVVYDDGTPVQVTEEMFDIDTKLNEITETGLIGSDNLINAALAILLQIVTKFTNDVKDRTFEAKIDAIQMDNAARTYNSDLYQSSATLSFRIANPFKCNYKTFFDENK